METGTQTCCDAAERDRPSAFTVHAMRRVAFLLLFATALAAAEPERGKLAENIASRLDPAQTYTLYLPNTYDAMKQQPLLFVFDPRGRGTFAAEIFKDAAERYGWVVISSNQTRSDDDGAANARAVRALLPEIGRYAIHPRRVYATGFSGTAILSCAIGINTSAFAGVIGVGGRLVEHIGRPIASRSSRASIAGSRRSSRAKRSNGWSCWRSRQGSVRAMRRSSQRCTRKTSRRRTLSPA